MRAGPFSATSAESPLIADPSRSLLMSATSTGRGSQRLPAGRGCPKEIVQGETVRNFVCEPVDEITRQWDRVARQAAGSARPLPHRSPRRLPPTPDPRDVDPVELAYVRLNIPRAHSPHIQRDDLVVTMESGGDTCRSTPGRSDRAIARAPVATAYVSGR